MSTKTLRQPPAHRAEQLHFDSFYNPPAPRGRRDIHVLLTDGSWSGVIRERLLKLGAQRVTVARTFHEMDSAYRRATHVLIPGGADIDPALYGETCVYAQPFAPERDALEYELVGRALDDRKPLFGICRGHQMIAVAAGGALYQDLHAQHGHEHASSHLVYTTAKSKMAKMVGVSALVNSYHHQAVKALPRGFRAVAYSADDTIEAMELPGFPLLSVQWHPEVLNDAGSRRLFTAFLALRSN